VRTLSIAAPSSARIDQVPDLFPPLPSADDLTATDGELVVRLARAADAESLYGLLILPEIRNPAGSPDSPDAVRGWIADELGPGAMQPNPGRDLIWVVEMNHVVVGSVVSALYVDRKGKTPRKSAEYYDVTRHPSIRGKRIARRMMLLVEPLLVRHFGVEQVTANVYKSSRDAAGLAAAASCGFGRPITELPDRYTFQRAVLDTNTDLL